MRWEEPVLNLKAKINSKIKFFYKTKIIDYWYTWLFSKLFPTVVCTVAILIEYI